MRWPNTKYCAVVRVVRTEYSTEAIFGPFSSESEAALFAEDFLGIWYSRGYRAFVIPVRLPAVPRREMWTGGGLPIYPPPWVDLEQPAQQEVT